MRYLAIVVLLAMLVACEPKPYDPSNPCLTEEDLMSDPTPTPIPYEVMSSVIDRHLDRFLGYPHFRSVGYGIAIDPRSTGPEPTILGRGISLGVSVAVDPATLPESQRIPACLDGVPVFIQAQPEVILISALPEPEEEGD